MRRRIELLDLTAVARSRANRERAEAMKAGRKLGIGETPRRIAHDVSDSVR